MPIQFVLGPAGSGKTEYLLNTLIKGSMENPHLNYFYIVPEQFTMEAQRDIVTMHPRHGSMNIDAIGLNRLAYRIFDELSVNPGQVMEDFGKSMLVQKILMEEKDNLLVYGSYLGKMGFVDEMKSMISELFQYAVDETAISDAMDQMDRESSVYRKLHDVRLIYDRFEEYNRNDRYIVAEQLSELLADNVERSNILADSHLYFDGFTGFTPVQMKLIRKLMRCVRSVTFAFAIDKSSISMAKPKEYELFRLTRETMISLCNAAVEEHVDIADNIVMDEDIPYRFSENRELAELQRNLFRYPHGKVSGNPENIRLIRADRARDEAVYVASRIRDLVKNEGYRYRDIAVVAGDLQDVSRYYRHAMDEYNIPVFIDANIALAGDPCSDTVRAFLAVMSENFSVDSVFRLLKSGMTDVDSDDIERMENYVLKRNIRGYKMWSRQISDDRDPVLAEDMDSIRLQIMEMFTDDCIDVFKPSSPNSKNTVKSYTKQLYRFLEQLDVCGRLENRKRQLYEAERWDEGDAYGRIFDKLVVLFDKMVTLLGDERMTVKEYIGILDAGLADMEIGIVPPTVDRVVVGDMTRSRLNHVRVLFFTGVNEGIIPKPAKKGKILSNSDRQILEDCGVTLAPSDKTNAYIEQFYIYTNLTKASDRVYIIYRKLGEDLRPADPSYLVDRIKGIYPDIMETDYDIDMQLPETADSILRYIIRESDNTAGSGIVEKLGELLVDRGCEGKLQAISDGEEYTNDVCTLTPDTVRMLYGTNLVESVSKLEKYAQCQFKYFLTYGLGLQERETCEVNAANIGNILHETMEKMFSFVQKFRDNDWEHLNMDELRERAVEFAGISADEEAGEYFEDSHRAAYMKELIADVAVRTIRTLGTFVRCGKMQPAGFERKFDTSMGRDGIDDYIFKLANGMTMNLKGTIDRIDEYITDNDIYFKIVDYKSSANALDEKLILGGLQLQLVTYGAIAYELEKRRAKTDKNVHMSGMLYYTFDNPYVDVGDITGDVELTEHGFASDDKKMVGGMSVDLLEEKLLKNSRFVGMYNQSGLNPEVMDPDMSTVRKTDGIEEIMLQKLMEANRNNINRLATDISNGKIAINPVLEDDVDACKYCSYRKVCAFDNKYSGNSYSHIYTGQKKEYETQLAEIEQLYADLKMLDKQLASAGKKYDSAKKKYKTAFDKVNERGDKATAKQREALTEAEKLVVQTEDELRKTEENRDRLASRAEELGLSIPN